jgi:hypothetical protein
MSFADYSGGRRPNSTTYLLNYFLDWQVASNGSEQ